jgi:hypothetical protein
MSLVVSLYVIHVRVPGIQWFDVGLCIHVVGLRSLRVLAMISGQGCKSGTLVMMKLLLLVCVLIVEPSALIVGVLMYGTLLSRVSRRTYLREGVGKPLTLASCSVFVVTR